MNNKTLSPCKDCKDRSRACHDTCSFYIEYKQKRDEEKRNEQLYNSLSHGASKSAICFSHRVVVGRGRK